MKTRKKLARRLTWIDTVVIDGKPYRVDAEESVGYGSHPEQTTIYLKGYPIPLHFWWDDKVDVLVKS